VRMRLVLAWMAGTGTALAGIGLLATAAYLILRAGEQPPILDLTTAIVGVRFFGISRAALRYAERLSAHDAALRIAGGYRAGAVAALHRITPGGIDRDRAGDLLERVTADVTEIQEATVRTLLPPAAAGASLLVAVAVAALIHPPSAWAFAAGASLTAAASFAVVLAAEHRRGRHLSDGRAALAAATVDLVEGAPEAVVFGRSDDLVAAAAEAGRRVGSLERSAAWSTGLGAAAVAAGTGITVWLVLRTALEAADAGGLDPLLVGVLAVLALAAFETVALLPRAAAGVAPARSAARRITSLQRRPDPVPVPEHPEPLPAEHTLELRDAWVRPAPGAPWALRGVDLRLAPGRRVALVGPSGAGKTTIAETLLRFRSPERGSYLVGGVDAGLLDPAAIRTIVGIAAEDAHLVSGSVLDNLRLARPDATEQEATRFLERVGLGTWLAALPDGLATPVGERGRQVSGGERRRLALARALLAGFPILIVDEPTANLDPDTAASVVREVFAAAGDRGVLLITHGSEGLSDADEVVTLADGCVAKRR